MGPEPEWSEFAVLPDVQYTGTSMFDPYWAREFHVSKRNEILHLVDGRANLEMEGRVFPGEQGDSFLIPKGVRHRDVFDTTAGLKAFIVSFEWKASGSFFGLVSNETLMKMPVHRKHEVARILERMRVDVHIAPPVDMLLASTRLHALLVLLLREAVYGHSRDERGNRRRRRLRRRELLDAVKSYLDDHYSEDVSLEDMAKMLGVSPFYLSHVFSQESDFTLFHYLMTLRMGKALKMIQAGDDKVSDIAAAVGYENPNYFARVFRKHYGFSPTDARKQLAEQQ